MSSRPATPVSRSLLRRDSAAGRAFVFDFGRVVFRWRPDDHLPNIAAARAAGWQAIHFVDAAQAQAEALALGW